MKNKYSHIIHKYFNGEIDLAELQSQLPDEDFKSWKDTLQLVENIQVSNFDTEAEFNQLIQNRDSKAEAERKNKIHFLKYIKIAAVFIVLISSSVLINNYYFKSTPLTSIAYNQNKANNTIVLPDNSKVYLNEESKISYNKLEWNTKRTVHLKGEAYFDVEKGEKFTVQTQLGVVQVLGTTFNVSTQDNLFTVTCYTGKVSVRYNDKNIILTSGQSVSNNNDKTMIVNQMMPQWLIKQSVFEASPLSQVVKDIEEQKDIKIDIKLDKNYTFTGGYSHQQTPEDILKLVSETLGFHYKKIGDKHFELVN